MHKLPSMTALGGTAPRVDTIAGVTCTEVTDLALASVSARLHREAACHAALGELLGLPAPAIGKAVSEQPVSAFWIGPDQWMLLADMATHEDLAAIVKAKLDDTASVTEQTDAWGIFDLNGDGVNRVVERLCNINLNQFLKADVTRTSIHHLGGFVICQEPSASIRIFGPRASAASLHHALIVAMKSAL